MKLMNNVFREFLDEFFIVFIDDILIYLKSKEGHDEHLRVVLQILQDHKLFAKMMKCSFWQKQIGFLSNIFSGPGVSVDPKKITTITHWPRPKNATEIHSFLGLASYYRKFAEGFASIAKPLTKLTCKEAKIEGNKPNIQDFLFTLSLFFDPEWPFIFSGTHLNTLSSFQTPCTRFPLSYVQLCAKTSKRKKRHSF